MTNTERHERIECLYAHAEREGREINDTELEEIERLSGEIYDEAQSESLAKSEAWLRSRLPDPQVA